MLTCVLTRDSLKSLLCNQFAVLRKDNRVPLLVIGYLVAAWYFSWWPFDNTERAIEASSFNVYFFPQGGEEYLGVAESLSQCQNVAQSLAVKNELSRSEWNYVCCRITSSSSCASKHR